MKIFRYALCALTLVGLARDGLAAGPLVDGAWLEQQRGRADVMVLDIRSQGEKAARSPYDEGHIPGAVQADYGRAGWRTKVDGVIGMLPPVERLESLIGALGIDNATHVVIVPEGTSAVDYGSATRVYWTFKVLGHDAVSILDGGHAGWVREGRALETQARTPAPVRFEARLRPELVASRADVLTVVQGQGKAALVDNRPPDQFAGASKHPEAPRAGAIPGARNVPEGKFFDAATGRFAGAEVLAALWKEAGIDVDQGADQITYCNTGHWASLGWFAASELLGKKSTRLYDGSMVDWAARPELPMVNERR